MSRIARIHLHDRDMIGQTERRQRTIAPIRWIQERAGGEVVGGAVCEQGQASCQPASEQMRLDGLSRRHLTLHDHGRQGMPPSQLFLPGFGLLVWEGETERGRPCGMGHVDPFSE